MTIKQVSIFLENRPESLSEITDSLAKANINMRSICLADTSDFGIVRIIVDSPEEVSSFLSEQGYVVKVTEVLAVKISDESGSLNNLLCLLAQNGRNVEYMYGFTGKKTNSAFMIIRCTDTQKTEKILTKNKIELLSQEQLKEV